MYDLGVGDSRALVAAATELLVEGCDAEPVVSLACVVVTPLTNPFEMAALVQAAREELRMSRLDPDATEIRAAQTQLRRWRRGLLTDRELSGWAHRAIGHEGSAALQELVVIDDVLDELDYVDDTLSSVHRDLEVIADELLALPDPWQ